MGNKEVNKHVRKTLGHADEWLGGVGGVPGRDPRMASLRSDA